MVLLRIPIFELLKLVCCPPTIKVYSKIVDTLSQFFNIFPLHPIIIFAIAAQIRTSQSPTGGTYITPLDKIPFPREMLPHYIKLDLAQKQGCASLNSTILRHTDRKNQ
jgi:hypothetical protein